MKRISQEKRARVRELRKCGLSQREIAKLVGIGRSTVSNIINRKKVQEDTGFSLPEIPKEAAKIPPFAVGVAEIGIDDNVVLVLENNGIIYLHELLYLTKRKLRSIPNIGRKRAGRIISAVRYFLKHGRSANEGTVLTGNGIERVEAVRERAEAIRIAANRERLYRHVE